MKRGIVEAARRFDIPERVVAAAQVAIDLVAAAWLQRDAQALTVSAKVYAAFARAGIDDSHLAGSTGYAYHERGRAAYDALVAHVMDAPAALARIQLVSATQAIVATLGALLPHGGRLCSITGKPYDTLHTAIVDHPAGLVRANE